MLFIVFIDITHGLHARILLDVVVGARLFCLIPVIDTADERRDQVHAGFGAGAGLGEGEQQRQVGVDAFFFQLFRRLDAFPGGGQFDQDARLIDPLLLIHEIIDASLNQGVIGDIAGYDFFNAQGQHVDTVMNDRVIGLSIDELRKIPCVIAIASENTKALAILGALRTGAIDIIATSALNIRTLLNMSQ